MLVPLGEQAVGKLGNWESVPASCWNIAEAGAVRATGHGGGLFSMQMADQIDSAAENQHRRNGPENEYGHLSTSLIIPLLVSG